MGRMAITKCKACQNEVSTSAKSCPKCGHPFPGTNQLLVGILAVLIVFAVGSFFFGGGLEQQAANSMADIKAKVANDAVTQFNIASRQGDPIQICVQAGLAAAAFLQAQDQTQYDIWKATEADVCRAAGLRR